MSKTLEVLVEARRLIAETGWTQNVLARDSASHPAHPSSDRACRFCSIGAIQRAEHTVNLGRITPARDVLRWVLDHNSIANFNDAPSRTKADVLAAFDRAIKEQEQCDAAR